MKALVSGSIRAAFGRAGVALVIAFVAAVQPAQAYLLRTTVNANDSSYDYNSDTGVTSAHGTSGGTVAPGTTVATSYAAGGGPGYSSAGVATASLLGGSLHVSNATDGFFGDAHSVASLLETVTFHAPGSGATTRTTIGIDLHLTGYINDLHRVSYLYGFSMGGSGGGGNVGWQATFLDRDDPRNGFGWAGSGGFGPPSGFDTWDLVAGLVDEFHFRGTLSFTGTESPEYLLQTIFSLRCANGTDCDFGHSAYLNFNLPAGVSFTSGSGLLLTGTVPAVPAPATPALLAAGLGGLGWLNRRRRT